MTQPHTIPIQVWAIGVGALLGILTVGASFNGFGPLPPPAGSVTLDGIAVNFTYNTGAPHLFGNLEQESCRDCPQSFAGGENDSNLRLFWFEFNSSYHALITLNVTSLVPFQAWAGLCFAPGPCHVTTTFSNAGDPWTLIPHEGRPWGVNLLVPDPAPSIPTGVWIYFNVTVDVVPA